MKVEETKIKLGPHKMQSMRNAHFKFSLFLIFFINSFKKLNSSKKHLMCSNAGLPNREKVRIVHGLA